MNKFKEWLKEMHDSGLIILVFWVLLTLALVSIGLLTPVNAEADRMGFVLCDPESTVNMRFEPRKTGTVIACMECGDPVRLDGKTHGQWLHVVTGDENGGWIHQGYIVGIKVTVGTIDAVATTKVRARNMVNGKLVGTLRKGQKVTVYAYSDECCYTSRGYIKTKFLKEVVEE